MELVLLQKVVNLGVLGDKVKVKPGYGRNFLIPYGKAVPATAKNVAEFEAKRAEYEAKANASTEGKLFGSVGPRDIAEAFTAAGFPLNKSEVVMGEGPLRRTGEFDIHVHLHADVETIVKVTVVPEA
jgi:large subunit ribosomal protein L9